jgi:hypothetical protein
MKPKTLRFFADISRVFSHRLREISAKIACVIFISRAHALAQFIFLENMKRGHTEAFTKQNIEEIRKRITTSLDEIGSEFGIDLTMGNVRFEHARFTSKLSGLVLSHKSKDQSSWNALCGRHGLKPQDWGKQIKCGKQLFVLLNINSKNSKYPVIASTEEGKSFKLSLASVCASLREQAEINQWNHLMREHQGDYNPHGIFTRGKCSATLGMGTNCGIYWTTTTQCATSPDCAACKAAKKSRPQRHFSDCSGDECGCDDCQSNLESLQLAGFTFHGWNDSRLLVDNPCLH